MARGLRLVIYDATQRAREPRLLGYSWQYGTHLYRALGRVDAAYGARSFAEAFEWLARHRASEPIQELQFWGHGKWGRIFIDRESLDRAWLQEGHAHHAAFCSLRSRLAPNALLWSNRNPTCGLLPRAPD